MTADSASPQRAIPTAVVEAPAGRSMAEDFIQNERLKSETTEEVLRGGLLWAREEADWSNPKDRVALIDLLKNSKPALTPQSLAFIVERLSPPPAGDPESIKAQLRELMMGNAEEIEKRSQIEAALTAGAKQSRRRDGEKERLREDLVKTQQEARALATQVAKLEAELRMQEAPDGFAP